MCMHMYTHTQTGRNKNKNEKNTYNAMQVRQKAWYKKLLLIDKGKMSNSLEKRWTFHYGTIKDQKVWYTSVRMSKELV